MFKYRSIPSFGAFLLALSFFFLSVSNPSAQQAMQDVVYLKNGSVIRGSIIEQIPNVSLRIQAKDGSLFVYKMEEIERITKEPLHNVEGRKNPGTALTLAVLPGMMAIHGAGQWHNGEIGKGCLFFAAGLISASTAISDPSYDSSGKATETAVRPAVGAIIFISSLVWSSIDAYRSAKRINRERGYASSGNPPRIALTFNGARKGSFYVGLRSAVSF